MTKCTVEFVGTGETTTVSDKQTILKACIERGIIREHPCRVGIYLACSAEISEGDVTQPAVRGLAEEEAERFTLTCMTHPQSDPRLDHGIYPPSIEDDAMATGTAADDD